MTMQIKTAEGILSLSNATDVRTTGLLCVRGHKGVTLGFLAPYGGGWVAGYDQALLEAAVAEQPTGLSRFVATLEEAAARLVRYPQD